MTGIPLAHHGDEMPAWVRQVLSAAQSDPAVTSPEWRWRLLINAADLPANAKLVAHIIESHAHNDDRAYGLGVGRLAKEAGLHADTVRRSTQLLERLELIEIVRRRDPKNRLLNLPNVFALRWPEQAPPLTSPTQRGTRAVRVPEWVAEGPRTDRPGVPDHVEEGVPDETATGVLGSAQGEPSGAAAPAAPDDPLNVHDYLADARSQLTRRQTHHEHPDNTQPHRQEASSRQSAPIAAFLTSPPIEELTG
jgi:hypothetical protein